MNRVSRFHSPLVHITLHYYKRRRHPDSNFNNYNLSYARNSSYHAHRATDAAVVFCSTAVGRTVRKIRKVNRCFLNGLG